MDGQTGDEPLAAGSFSAWLADIQRALRGEADSDVPCGGCTACCTSSQFVHIGPEETATLTHIPAELLFPAPGLPNGHFVLGYDENGNCPMLIGGACSIYEHRPRTCRTYDCRVFPAAGVTVEEPGQAAVGKRAQRWRFDFEIDDDTVRHEAVRAAARFVKERADVLPDGAAPVNCTQRAVLAVRLHDLFLDAAKAPGPEAVKARLAAGANAPASRPARPRRRPSRPA